MKALYFKLADTALKQILTVSFQMALSWQQHLKKIKEKKIMLVTSNKKERISETSVLFCSGSLPHPITQHIIQR